MKNKAVLVAPVGGKEGDGANENRETLVLFLFLGKFDGDREDVLLNVFK